MDNSLNRALVRTILEHAEDYPWVMQEIGLLGLRLDDTREYRLHVWDPGSSGGEPPIHDHPFDFTSTVVAGEMTNTRYTEDPLGVEYHRVRYTPPNEDDRRSDTVRLAGTATTFAAGDQYHQLAHELHDSRQLPGTVTVIRRTFTRDASELTVCNREAAGWVSGRSRPADLADVKRIIATALELFSSVREALAIGHPVRVRIRPFDASDAGAVVDLSLRAWAPVHVSIREALGPEINDALQPDWRAKQQLDVEDVLAATTNNAWVADVDDVVAGFVAVRIHDDRRIGEIEMLAVDPARQGAGIGTALTKFALDWIKASGISVAMVGTGADPGHAPARRTYEKAGMKLVPMARYFMKL